MFIRTFHNSEFYPGTSGLTGMICVHHDGIDIRMDISIIENIVTERAEITKVISFIRD
jgi:hypothetical protein